MMLKETIALVDLKLTGHHPVYLATFADVLSDVGYDVHIYVDDVERAIRETAKARPSFNSKRFRFFASAAARYKRRILGCRSWQKLFQLQREIKNREAKMGYRYKSVFFASMDDFVADDVRLPYLLLPPFRLPFSGLVFSPRARILHPRFKRTRISSSLFTTALRSQAKYCKSIAVLDERVKSDCEHLLGKKVLVFPDFCQGDLPRNSDHPLIAEIHHRARGRKIVSLIGSVYPNKSVDVFIECIKQCRSRSVFFVIAGRIAEEAFTVADLVKIRSFIASTHENVLTFDNFIPTEAVFDEIIRCSSYMFTYYRNFPNSSNIVTKSAHYRVPVISNGQGVVGHRVRSYKLGLTLNMAEVTEFFRNPDGWSFSYDEQLLATFLRQQSAARLPDLFRNLLSAEEGTQRTCPKPTGDLSATVSQPRDGLPVETSSRI